MTASKIVLSAASGAGGSTTDIDDLFSTFLYDGTGSAQTITNNIDLSGEGGLVWSKSRSQSRDHTLVDTVRGATKRLKPNDSVAEATVTGGVNQFNNNGYNIGANTLVNENGEEHVSWTFRKAEKFMDIVTFTGSGSGIQTVNHNLGVAPAMMFVKKTSGTGNWLVWHKDLTNTHDKYLQLNTNDAEQNYDNIWGENGYSPTSTQFKVQHIANESGTYVAYLFANNNTDGEYGPDSDDDVIKCFTFQADANVNLGFEPQWIIVKRVENTGAWWMFDSTRGIPIGTDQQYVVANSSGAEGGVGAIRLNSTGFLSLLGSSSHKYIGMAIRRGPLATPTSSSEVFSIDSMGSSAPYFDSTHLVDMALVKTLTSSGHWYLYARHLGEKYLSTSQSIAQQNASEAGFDFMLGHLDSSFGSGSPRSWMWKRAPGYFDFVQYNGNSQADEIIVNHNLGVVPEMMWAKKRDSSGDWMVYHKDMNGGTTPQNYRMRLNNSGAEAASSGIWNNTAPTATQLRLGVDSDVNTGADAAMVFLFATVAGVSKVGSYSGNGSNQNIDCGFSNGAKFILIKSRSSGHWHVFDTNRGIVADNDSTLKLSTDDAESLADSIDPYSAGFNVVQNSTTDLNKGPADETYIFYAIAA